MKSLFVGASAAHLPVMMAMIVVGPLLTMRERLRRRADRVGRGRAA